MTGPGEHNYTDLPPSASAPSGAQVVQPSYKDPSNKPPALSRLSNLALLVGAIALVGSLAFAITRTQQTSGTRAATESFDLDPAKRAFMPESTAFLTRTITEYPRSYNGKAIPSTLYQEAERTLFTVSPEDRKKFIINRVAIYFVMRDVLSANGVSFDDPGENPTFAQIEDALPQMKIAVDKNLLSTADFAFVKAFFTTFNNIDKAQAKFGTDLQPKAFELVEKYRQKFIANPSSYQQIVDEANADPDLQLMTNSEKAMYFTNYFADLNNIPEQDNYIYDEEFDDVLFTKLKAGEVSQVIGFGSDVPYMYIVVYPTRIEIKKYQSLKDIMSQKLASFSY